MEYKPEHHVLNRIYRQAGLWTLVGLVLIILILILVDIRQVAGVFYRMDLRFLPLIFIMAPLNYIFRYIKWNIFLDRVGVRMPRRVNRLIFLSGLSMTITPGKIGELLKSYLIRRYNGTPISKTAPVILAERITDGLAVIVLASIGSLSHRYGRYVLAVSLVFLLTVLCILYYEHIFGRFTSLMRRVSFLEGYAEHLENLQRNAHSLFQPHTVGLTVGIGVLSWGFEGLVVFFSVLAFGGSVSVLDSLFVVSFSAIAGAISIFPGGMGVTEGSILGILLFLGTSTEVAAATMFMTRFSTLWLGVVIGLGGLYRIQPVFRSSESKN